jgi:archaemetzincin
MSLNKILFLCLLFVSCTKKVDKTTAVGIQSYAGFSKEKADSIAMIIRHYYKVKTIVLPVIDLPKSTFTNVKSPRYRADKLLAYQNAKCLDTLDFILGLTDKDISTTKKDNSGNIKSPQWKYQDWGVMGLGQCPGSSCIISIFRINHKESKIVMTRLKKVAVHEFGHNLGLPHCPNKNCVMTDAVENIATIDREKLALCKACKAKI